MRTIKNTILAVLAAFALLAPALQAAVYVNGANQPNLDPLGFNNTIWYLYNPRPVAVDEATDVITLTAHGLAIGTQVAFEATTFPGGMAARTWYYIIEATADTFKIATAAGGTAIDLVGAGDAVNLVVNGPAVAPVGGAGHQYVATYIVRSPNDADNATFLGEQLVLNGGANPGTLRLKANTAPMSPKIVNIPALVLNGGILDNGNNDSLPIVTGNIIVSAPSIIRPFGERFIGIQAPISGSQGLTVDSGGILVLSGANPNYSGTITLAAGSGVQLQAFGQDSLARASIVANDNTRVDIGYNANSEGTLTLNTGSRLYLYKDVSFSAVTIAGTALAEGTHTWATLNSQYPAIVREFGSGSITVVPTTAAPSLVTDIANQTVAAGSGVTFRFVVRGSGLSYQWLTNGVVDASVNGLRYTIPSATVAMNGMTIQCRVSNANGSLDSATATLSVPAGPILTAVNNYGSTNHLVAVFSEAVDPASVNVGAFAIAGVNISAAQMAGANKVVLTTTGFDIGANYTLTVTGVTDTEANAIASPNNTLAFTPFKYGVGYLKTDFSGSDPKGLVPGTRYGPAKVVATGSQYWMRLTDAVNSDSGTWITGDLGLGTNQVSRMTVRFKTVIGGGSDTPADGFCFSFAPDLPNGAWSPAEEGIGSGLSVMFDIYNNGNNEAPALDVKVNGSIIATKGLALAGLVKYPEQTQVTIDLAQDGTLNVSFGSVIVAENVATGWAPRSGRFGFGARTGGLNSHQWVSDLEIDTYFPYTEAGNGPVVFTTQPADFTQVERGTASFNVAVSGAPNFSYQWKANGTPIPGATSPSFSTLVSMAMNGTVYTVDVTNPFGVFTSAPATLTVTNDITPPMLVSGNASEAAGRIRLFFSEPLLDTPEVNAILTAPGWFEIKDSQDQGVDTTAATNRVSADRRSLTIDGLTLVAGQLYTVELLSAVAPQVLDLSSNALATPAITPAFPAWTGFQAGVRWMKYTGLSGGAMANFTNNVKFPYTPDLVFTTPGTVPGSAGDVNLADMFYFTTSLNLNGAGPDIAGMVDEGNYGAYAATLISPPQTGNYVFQAYSDDGSVVSISSNDNPANKQAIIVQGGCCNWLSSPSIYLEAGKTYYLEAMYTEGGGGDGIRVQWRLPGAANFVDITSANANYAVNYHWFNINLATNQLADESHPVAIAANIPAAAAFWMVAPTALQWYRSTDGGATYAAITDATNMTYNIPAAALTDDGSKFYLQLSLAGGAYSLNSPVQTLNVQPDATAPIASLGAGSQYFVRTIILNFSEPMEAVAAQNVANYTLTAPAVVQSATLQPGGTRVVLVTSMLDPMTEYTVTLQNLTDNSPSHIALATTNFTFRTPFMIYGYAKREKFKDGTAINAGIGSLKTNAKFINNQPSLVAWLSLFETPTNEDDNYGQRVTTWLLAPTTGEYQLGTAADDDSEVWLSSDETPANKTMVASWYGWSGVRNYQGQSGPITLTAGMPRYIEGLMSEGGGGDNFAVAVVPNGAGFGGVAPISADWMVYLQPYSVSSTTVTVTQQPVDELGYENGEGHFTVAGTAENPSTVLYQWQRFDGVQWNNLVNSTNITGAKSANLTVKNLKVATDNGAQFRCVLSNPGTGSGGVAQAISAAATLTVELDTIAPFVAEVSGTPYNNMVYVRFSETLFPDIITEQPGLFTLTGPGVNTTADAMIMLQDQYSAMLIFSGAVLTNGQTYTLMANTEGIFDQGINFLTYDNPAAVSNFVAWASQANVMRWDRFNGDAGANNFGTTQANPLWPSNPSEIQFRDSANSPSAIGEHYSVRMLGYFVPPETGTYRFRAEADDSARIILSSDPNASFQSSAATTIGNWEGDCGSCGDGHYSSTVSLIAGVPYYMELWFQEGTGGDYLYVAFTNDNPSAVYSVWPALGAFGNITSNMLVYALNPADATIMTQPQSKTITDGTATSFRCVVGYRALPATYQWQRHDGADFVNIPGATSSTYNTPLMARSVDNGAQYRCVVTVYGSQQIISDVAVLTVDSDTTPPTMVSVSSAGDYQSILVRFSKAVTPASVAAGTYAINNGVTVLGAELQPDGRTALLLTSFQNPGGAYTLTVTGVEDTTELHNPIVPGSQITYTNRIYVPGLVRIRRYDGIGGTAVSALTGAAAFPNFPNYDNYASAMTYRPNMDNYGAYLTGFFVPPQTADYTFYTSSDDASQVFLSTDANPANKVMVAREDGCCGGYVNNIAGSTKRLIGGQIYYIEALIKEGGGGDYIDVAYSTDGGTTKTLISGSAIGDASLPDPGISLVINQQPASASVPAGQSVTLTTVAVETPSSPFLKYQWQKNGVNIPSANSSSYTTPLLSVFDSGATYRCIVVTKGAAVISDTATITVSKAENDPATIAYVGSIEGLKVGVKFNEAVMAASATNPMNYAVQAISGFALGPVTRPGDQVMGFPSSDPLLTIDFVANDAGFTAATVDGFTAGPGPWSYNAASGTWSCFGNQEGGGPYASALQSPALTAPFTGTYYVTALHRHSFEPDGANGWDGGQLRMSVNGGPFTTVTTFSSGGYGGTISGTGPIQGQMAFVGKSAGYDTGGFYSSTAVISGINAGDQVAFQFLASWDDNTIGDVPNWEVKSISIADSALAQAWPAAENPANAVDNLLRSKYLNFGITNTGFTVVLNNRTQALHAVRITSANDAPERDPASIKVEGSTDGVAFTTVLDTTLGAFASRGSQQTLTLPAPSAPYSVYKVTFPTVASTNATSMQVAEVELLGVATAANVLSAVMQGNSTVVLTLDTPVKGEFQVGSQGIIDLSDNTNALSFTTGNCQGWFFMDSSRMVSGNAGDPNPAGQVDWSVSDDSKTVVNVGGSDIWNTADGFNFIYKEVDGDFDISVRVESIDPASRWSKAGLMIRESLAANSRNHSVVADPARIPAPRDGQAEGADVIEANFRATQNGGTSGWDANGGVLTGEANQLDLVPGSDLPYPNVWVRLVRKSGVLTAYGSTNGVDWIAFIDTTDTYPSKVFVGRSTTSHNQGNNTTVVYSDFKYMQYIRLATEVAAGEISISWPVEQSGGYILQGTGSLTPPVIWTEITSGITTNGNTKTFNVQEFQFPAQYYRLIKPQP